MKKIIFLTFVVVVSAGFTALQAAEEETLIGVWRMEFDEKNPGVRRLIERIEYFLDGAVERGKLSKEDVEKKRAKMIAELAEDFGNVTYTFKRLRGEDGAIGMETEMPVPSHGIQKVTFELKVSQQSNGRLVLSSERDNTKFKIDFLEPSLIEMASNKNTQKILLKRVKKTEPDKAD